MPIQFVSMLENVYWQCNFGKGDRYETTTEPAFCESKRELSHTRGSRGKFKCSEQTGLGEYLTTSYYNS